MSKKNSQKYPTEMVIQAIKDTKGMLTLTAQRLDCAYTTLQDYIARNPEIAQAYKETKESLLDAVELTLYDKAIKERDTTALIFLAKTQGKQRGYTERQETEHSGGLEIKVIRDKSNRNPSE